MGTRYSQGFVFPPSTWLKGTENSCSWVGGPPWMAMTRNFPSDEITPEITFSHIGIRRQVIRKGSELWITDDPTPLIIFRPDHLSMTDYNDLGLTLVANRQHQLFLTRGSPYLLFGINHVTIPPKSPINSIVNTRSIVLEWPTKTLSSTANGYIIEDDIGEHTMSFTNLPTINNKQTKEWKFYITDGQEGLLVIPMFDASRSDKQPPNSIYSVDLKQVTSPINCWESIITPLVSNNISSISNTRSSETCSRNKTGSSLVESSAINHENSNSKNFKYLFYPESGVVKCVSGPISHLIEDSNMGFCVMLPGDTHSSDNQLTLTIIGGETVEIRVSRSKPRSWIIHTSFQLERMEQGWIKIISNGNGMMAIALDGPNNELSSIKPTGYLLGGKWIHTDENKVQFNPIIKGNYPVHMYIPTSIPILISTDIYTIPSMSHGLLFLHKLDGKQEIVLPTITPKSLDERLDSLTESQKCFLYKLMLLIDLKFPLMPVTEDLDEHCHTFTTQVNFQRLSSLGATIAWLLMLRQKLGIKETCDDSLHQLTTKAKKIREHLDHKISISSLGSDGSILNRNSCVKDPFQTQEWIETIGKILLANYYLTEAGFPPSNPLPFRYLIEMVVGSGVDGSLIRLSSRDGFALHSWPSSSGSSVAAYLTLLNDPTYKTESRVEFALELLSLNHYQLGIPKYVSLNIPHGRRIDRLNLATKLFLPIPEVVKWVETPSNLASVLSEEIPKNPKESAVRLLIMSRDSQFSHGKVGLNWVEMLNQQISDERPHLLNPDISYTRLGLELIEAGRLGGFLHELFLSTNDLCTGRSKINIETGSTSLSITIQLNTTRTDINQLHFKYIDPHGNTCEDQLNISGINKLVYRPTDIYQSSCQPKTPNPMYLREKIEGHGHSVLNVISHSVLRLVLPRLLGLVSSSCEEDSLIFLSQSHHHILHEALCLHPLSHLTNKLNTDIRKIFRP